MLGLVVHTGLQSFQESQHVLCTYRHLVDVDMLPELDRACRLCCVIVQMEIIDTTPKRFFLLHGIHSY